jgi:hypothetical protein
MTSMLLSSAIVTGESRLTGDNFSLSANWHTSRRTMEDDNDAALEAIDRSLGDGTDLVMLLVSV